MKQKQLKTEKTQPMEVTDVRKGAEDRKRVERLEKNVNFTKGSKYLPNTPLSNEYRYKRKQDKLIV